jgi:hypothetical protein
MDRGKGGRKGETRRKEVGRRRGEGELAECRELVVDVRVGGER